MLSVALVVAGVSGELVIASKLGRIETSIRDVNERRVLCLQQEAGDAAQSAKTAHDLAQGASEIADAAKRAAGEAQDKARAAIAEANLVLHAVGDRFVLHPAAFRDDMRKRFGPSPAAVKASRGTAVGRSISLTSYSGDREGFRLCKELWGLMEGAQMATNYVCGSTTLRPASAPAVGIEVLGSNEADVKDLASLLASKSDASLPSVSIGVSTPGLKVFVASKEGIIAGPATPRPKTKTRP
jgi:hypothetical protein